MKRLIVRVANKANLHELKMICNVMYVSKYINVVGVEIKEENIPALRRNDNVVNFRESEEGIYQPSLTVL